MTLSVPLEFDLADAEAPREPHPAQWRMSRVELVNWGTFQGHHRIDVARKGHLLTGHSGSGKSSLLDAIATVLTPRKWLRFNAAAGDSPSQNDRSLVSYIRGAWRRQTDEETGDAVAQYLRPLATWSGILLRFDTADGAEPINLVRLFHLRRGANAVADVSELYLSSRGEQQLLDFQAHARDGIEMRRIKAAWPDAAVTKDFSAFFAKFRRVLGIQNEGTLQLLHKTQSAKNLGSLDQLFRGFMLDEPRTFEMARTAVEQFSELSDAHHRVVEARRQVDLLRRVQEPAEAYEHAVEQGRAADVQLAALRDYTDQRILDRARREREELGGTLAHAQDALRLAQTDETATGDAAELARRLVYDVGGSELDALLVRIQGAEQRHADTRARREQWTEQLRRVGVPMPATAEEFDQLRAAADRDRASAADDEATLSTALFEQHDGRSEAQRRLLAIDEEIAQLRASRSNIDARLLRARALVAEKAGLPIGAFPFAGELIDVLPESAAWSGAIERVLRPLATVMLVQDAHIGDVTHIVNDTHLGTRLVFESVPLRAETPRPSDSARSLLNRIRVLDGPNAQWLRHRLSDRYDYACVDNARQLRDVRRGVTPAGQVKHGSRSFEKDDRSRVEDRSRWILGSDSTEKLERLFAARAAVDTELQKVTARIDAAATAAKAAATRAATLNALQSIGWADVDADTVAEAEARLRERHAQLRDGNAELAAAEARADEAKLAHEHAVQQRREAERSVMQLDGRAAELDAQITALGARESDWDIATATAEALGIRFAGLTRSQSRQTLQETATAVSTALGNERSAAERAMGAAAREFDRLAKEVNDTWPALTSDLSPVIDDRAGYLALLDRIVATRLPEYESRFFDLLTTQSRQLTGNLLQEIRLSRSRIHARIEPVNASLRRSPFDTGRFLQIQVKDKRTGEVTEFVDDLRTISSDSWGAEDRAAAERRFLLLRRLMDRLGSTQEQAWARRCLDTREHVTFVGVEQDEDGAEMNRHDSGAGLSGGQRQKLVIFCLAAALRYQLAEDEHDVPAYGTIVLDEAFDKADAEFTRMAMDVFEEFGFHMVLATPLKLLQTLEGYVGAVSKVSCLDHQDSRVATIAIESVE
ncbi:AAA family ATPase [Microbacteriaceae bacterium VKM Ac-2855]|nr:AAA family ATPase [Microbacteriaceae bacterium VKM Ac-2855]